MAFGRTHSSLNAVRHRSHRQGQTEHCKVSRETLTVWSNRVSLANPRSQCTAKANFAQMATSTIFPSLDGYGHMLTYPRSLLAEHRAH